MHGETVKFKMFSVGCCWVLSHLAPLAPWLMLISSWILSLLFRCLGYDRWFIA